MNFIIKIGLMGYVSHLIYQNRIKIAIQIFDIYSKILFYGKKIYNECWEKTYYLLYSIGIYNHPYPEFVLKNVTLYRNENRENIIIDRNITKIDCDFFKKYGESSRIKMEFTYEGEPYILFIPSTITQYIPFPPYTREIMKKYSNNMIEPYYPISDKNFHSYQLFQIDLKNIEQAHLIYKIDSHFDQKIDILSYIKKISTPFGDMGLHYNSPVYLSWLCDDHDINKERVDLLYVKYSNFYFNEETMELEDIQIQMKDVHGIISPRIAIDFMTKKNKENPTYLSHEKKISDIYKK